MNATTLDFACENADPRSVRIGSAAQHPVHPMGLRRNGRRVRVAHDRSGFLDTETYAAAARTARIPRGASFYDRATHLQRSFNCLEECGCTTYSCKRLRVTAIPGISQVVKQAKGIAMTEGIVVGGGWEGKQAFELAREASRPALSSPEALATLRSAKDFEEFESEVVRGLRAGVAGGAFPLDGELGVRGRNGPRATAGALRALGLLAAEASFERAAELARSLLFPGVGAKRVERAARWLGSGWRRRRGALRRRWTARRRQVDLERGRGGAAGMGRDRRPAARAGTPVGGRAGAVRRRRGAVRGVAGGARG